MNIIEVMSPPFISQLREQYRSQVFIDYVVLSRLGGLFTSMNPIRWADLYGQD